MEFLKLPTDPFANTTCKWKIADNEKQYQKVKATVPYGPEDITYIHNSDGFRCDEFKNWNDYPYRILFAGCSLTEGVGLPLEDTWAKIVHNKICKLTKTDIPFWSIARGGTGIDQMVRYMVHYMEKLKPQIVISYIPHAERRERWYNDFYGPWAIENNDSATTTLLDEKYVNYQTEKNLVMIDLILERYNSIMVSSTVNHSLNLDYMHLRNILQSNNTIMKIDLARDGIHAGPKTNKLFAEMIFKNYWPIIEEKLGLT